MDVLHVAIDVADVERTSAFYEELLGLEHTRDFEIDGTLNYCVGGTGPAEIQFVEVGSAVEPAGIDHLSVAADDVEAVVEEATSEWDSEVVRGPTTIEDQAKIAFVTDPDGYEVELIEEL